VGPSPRRRTVQSLPLAPPLPRGAGEMIEGAFIVALDDSGEVEETVRALLVDVLGLAKSRVAAFDDETELFGALPEFDSMAVATLLTEMEERLGILIEDEDVEAEDLMSFGRLLSFAKRKALT
jgi:acyl carrier protein